LLPVLETFKGLMMWTFTVDPKLFGSPAEAFDYVRDERCISNVMRELRRRGFLHSNRYFVVVEWQMGKGDEPGTEMAHWHLLTDASFIPFELVCTLWNRFRPASAGPVEGDRPGFGSVRFSAPEFESAAHAAHYACKYLIKYPEKGYPAWVLDKEGQVHRYSTSRGFWGGGSDDSDADAAQGADCESGDGGKEEAAAADEPRAAHATVRERLAKCGERSVVVRVVEGVVPETGELVERREFVARLAVPVDVVARAVQRDLVEGERRLRGLSRSVLSLLQRFREDQA
jgi:hypothetical protein